MTRKDNHRSICFFVALTFLVLASSASASLSRPAIDLSHLNGIDTVIVDRSTVPESTLLPPRRTYTAEELKTHPTDPLNAVVKDLFSKQPWIKFRLRSDLPAAERNKPNVLALLYAISAQQDTYNGATIKVGAVTLQLRRHDSVGQEYSIPVIPVVYPFVIPNTDEAFQKKVEEGIRYLTSYIPDILTCANRPEASSENPCLMENPFKERLSVPCRPPDPRPCAPYE